MLNNPSYLIKSRHDIYYFRYPLPTEAQGKSNRVSISLKTRCPREALRLAKALEYHSVNLIEGMDLRHMDHADIMSIFKDYYAEVLERAKARIDEDGQLSKQNVHNITKHLKELDTLIKSGSDDELELLGLDTDNPEDGLVHKDLQPIMEKYELDFEPESKEYPKLNPGHDAERCCLHQLHYDAALPLAGTRAERTLKQKYKFHEIPSLLRYYPKTMPSQELGREICEGLCALGYEMGTAHPGGFWNMPQKKT